MIYRWSLIAAQLPGRTDNDVKNHWNTKLKKKLSGMGIDPVTHKPFSHLMAEIATTLPPPQVAHLAEAALGCFKDEMLHLLTKKRIDFTYSIPQPPGPVAAGADAGADRAYHHSMNPMDDKEDTIQKIKLGLSRAIMQEPGSDKGWTLTGTNGEPSDGLAVMCNNTTYPMMENEFRYRGPSYGNDREGSGWSQSMCTSSTCTGGGGVAEQHGNMSYKKHDDDDGEEAEGGEAGRKADAEMFGSDCVLWDLSDDLMNHIV